MTELNPVTQLYGADANAVDSAAPAGQTRLTVNSRPSGATRAVLWESGQASVGATDTLSFMNGTAWDMTVNGANTNQTFSILASSKSSYIAGISLLMLTTSRPPVFNGSSFGGQYLGGLLGTAVITPAALNNGLLLQCSAAGVTTTLATLQVNEDFFSGNQNAQFGSTGGPYLMRAKWDINQMLTGGSGDKITITVRDDMTSRGIVEIRATAMSVLAS